MKHAISTRWLTNPNQGCSQISHTFWGLNDFIVHYQSKNSFMLMKWSYRSRAPIRLNIDPRMVYHIFEYAIYSLLRTCLFLYP